jgi:hypothetical protein
MQDGAEATAPTIAKLARITSSRADDRTIQGSLGEPTPCVHHSAGMTVADFAAGSVTRIATTAAVEVPHAARDR